MSEMHAVDGQDMTNRLARFYGALDYRLLDHATGSGIIDVAEYEAWARSRDIRPLAGVRVVEDAIAAAFQDAFLGLPAGYYWQLYNEVREAAGLPFLAHAEGTADA